MTQALRSGHELRHRDRHAHRAEHSRDWNSQRVVSFTEAPLDELHTFFAEVDEQRRNKFQPYGLAFTKMQARRNGVTPVWYTVTRAQHWRANHVWNLVDEAKARGDFPTSDIAQIAPFVDSPSRPMEAAPRSGAGP